MENKYYNPEAVKDLAYEVFQAMETLKRLYSADDNKQYLTVDLIEAFKDLNGDCDEFLTAFEYYTKKNG